MGLRGLVKPKISTKIVTKVVINERADARE